MPTSSKIHRYSKLAHDMHKYLNATYGHLFDSGVTIEKLRGEVRWDMHGENHRVLCDPAFPGAGPPGGTHVGTQARRPLLSCYYEPEDEYHPDRPRVWWGNYQKEIEPATYVTVVDNYGHNYKIGSQINLNITGEWFSGLKIPEEVKDWFKVRFGF